MPIKKIFEAVSNSSFLILEDEELTSVLSVSEIIREEDTHLSDFIRILRYKSNIFVQEISFKKEIIIRKMNSIANADKFVNDRLEYYERKWDGCGCKIDYYE